MPWRCMIAAWLEVLASRSAAAGALVATTAAMASSSPLTITGVYRHDPPIEATLEIMPEAGHYRLRLEGGVPLGQGAASPADCTIEAKGDLAAQHLEARFPTPDTASDRQPGHDTRKVELMFGPQSVDVVHIDLEGYCPALSVFSGRYSKVGPP